MQPVKPTNKNFANYLVAVSKQNQDIQQTIRALLSIKPEADSTQWRGLIAVPPGSQFERFLGAFRRETNIPLEIPFFCFLHFICGWLLQHKVKIQGAGMECYPDIWTIVLAPSGAGKTLTHDTIAKASPVKSTIPEPVSEAAFFSDLAQNNFGLWFVDEIAQLLKEIDTKGTPLSKVKSHLLKAYSYSSITRSTKTEGTAEIEEPCLGILGLNTPESFRKAMSDESLTDGFAQRFCYVYAERDPERSARDYPLFNLEMLTKYAKYAFDEVTAKPPHPIYKLGKEATVAFRESFSMLFTEHIPESFFRRILHRGIKYSLYYHLILAKDSDELDTEDIAWGARLAGLHLADVKKLLHAPNLAGIGRLVENARKHRDKLRAQGVELTPRLLRQKVHGITDNEQAAAVLAMLDD